MTQNDKFKMQRRAARRGLWRWLGEVPALPLKLLMVVLYLAGAVWVWSKHGVISAQAETIPLLSPVFKAAMLHAVPAYLLVGGVGLAALPFYPFGKRDAADQLQSIGLVNRAEMVPELRRKRRDPEHPNVTVWEFRNQGIPLTEWENKRAAIEAALDVNIVKLKYSKGKSRVMLYAVPAASDLPPLLRWKDEYLSPENFVLTLGESLTGPVQVDLNKIPHILLGGSTGSGKSVLLKLLLMQAVKKGALVYVADFKGSIDYPYRWADQCEIVCDEEELLKLLERFLVMLEQRKKAFLIEGCANLDEYNHKMGSHVPRLIFACDEVAEMLDRTGRSKEDKETLAKIENRLATLARLGRAFGIHLILATQRPDANVIPGQIKSNLDFRVCGRADSILSGIILGNGSADEQIPKDARGRFITGDGTVFQGYLFDEDRL